MTPSILSGWLHSPLLGLGVAVVTVVGAGAWTSYERLSGTEASQPPRVLGTRFDAEGGGSVRDSGAGGKEAKEEKKAFSMSGTVLGLLQPGAERTLRVTVTNPNSQDIQLLQVGAVAQDPGQPGCQAAWIVVDGYEYAGGSPVVVGRKGGTATLDLSITLTNLPDVNQDGCKSATFPLVLSGSARSAT